MTSQWKNAEKEKPESGVKVLILDTDQDVWTGVFIERFSVSVTDDCDLDQDGFESAFERKDDDDLVYLKEGFYKQFFNPETYEYPFIVQTDVTHWINLPALPVVNRLINRGCIEQYKTFCLG